MARWGDAYIDKRVGASFLMSAVDLSHGLRSLMCARKGMLCLPSLAHHLFSTRVGFGDTDEVKYRNAHLSH